MTDAPGVSAAGGGAAAAAAALTQDEATVYDRQLRVWGVEVQKKLTAARVLIAGFGKLAAEVAKNVTLAGVGSVTLLDDAPAAAHEGGSFLVTTPAPAGASCAEAAAKTLQVMNPLVRVAAAPGAPPSRLLDPEFLSQFDLVIAAGQPPSVARRAGDACAARGVKFMAAAVRGSASYYFADLGSHSYKPKGDGDAAGGEAQMRTLEYARLSAALAAPFAGLPANCHPLVPVLLACAATEEELGRPLAPADAPAVAATLQRLTAAAGAGAAAWAAPAARQLPGWVAATGEFAPTAAVVGGVIGNDVVRAVSHSDEPTHNMFLYSLTGRPLVHVLPPPGAADGAAAGAAGGGAAAGQQQQQQRAAAGGGDEVVLLDD